MKFNDEDGEKSFLSKFINGIRYFYDNVVTPVFEIAKNLFEITYNIVSRVVKFCVKHPKLTLFILGAIKFLENIKGIKTTVNIAKMIGGSPFNAILGIGASLATEAIMGGLFKSKSEENMTLTIRSLENVEIASKYMNTSVV